MGSLFRALKLRPLTPGEVELAREAFGSAVALESVRLVAWPFRRAFVPGRWFARDWIVWPHRSLRDDLSVALVGLQGVLVHELTHVWQAQQGVNLLLAKLRAGDRAASYAYPTGPECRWDALNIEQQAMVMEHHFHCRRGGRALGTDTFYARICPFGTEYR